MGKSGGTRWYNTSWSGCAGCLVLLAVMLVVGVFSDRMKREPARSKAKNSTQASETGALRDRVFVVAELAEERSEPSASAEVLNRVYAGQALPVFARSEGWIRITPDGAPPRWVEERLVSSEPPPPPGSVTIPSKYRDSRIEPSAIPTSAGNGLSEADVLLLWRGAKHMLDTGVCNRIDYADKSTSEPGKYFVQEGTRTVYFKEENLR